MKPELWRHLWLVWGTLITAAYLSVLLLSGARVPVRVLYDGEAPLPPYRWVRPPANIPGPHEAAESGSGTVPLSPLGSEPAVIPTGDGQAFVTFPRDAIEPRAGESSIQVSIVPRDPLAVPPPPRGFQSDGNAYTIEGAYTRSRQPVALRGAVTVVLRYPVHATQVLRLAAAQWAALPTNRVAATQQLSATTDRLGTFIAVAPAAR